MPERKAAMQEELDGWREELEKWRKLQERQTTCDRIEQKDLPNERQELEAAEKDSAAAFKSYQSVGHLGFTSSSLRKLFVPDP